MKISPQSYPHLSQDVDVDTAANGDELVINGTPFPVVRRIIDVTKHSTVVIVAKTRVRLEVQSELESEINAIREDFANKGDGVSEVDILLANDAIAKLDINSKVEDQLINEYGFTAS